MAIKKKKISDFPLLTQSLRGFFTIGYKEVTDQGETTAESYKADLGFVEEAARGADTAAQGATAAAARADASAQSADSAAGQALSAAEQAASAAQSATQTAAAAAVDATQTAAAAAVDATQTAADAAAEATQTAREAATKATQIAEEAAATALQSATDAAANADLKAAYAQTQGDYAHEQAATIDAKIGSKVDLSSVGQPEGVASLDADGHVPLAQLGSLAVDHTSLTEQVVPGEFWLDADGVTKRQVYIRTLVGNTPTSNSSLLPWLNNARYFILHSTGIYHKVILVAGHLDVNPPYIMEPELYYNIMVTNPGGLAVILYPNTLYLNTPFSLTIKYTKR